MSRRPLCPPWPPPSLSLAAPGGMSSSSWATRMAAGRNAEEVRQRRHGLAAAVHVGGGDEQTNVAALMAELADQAEVLSCRALRLTRWRAGQALNEKSPCVVPGLFVFGAGVTQADDQLDGSHVRGSSAGLQRVSDYSALSSFTREAWMLATARSLPWARATSSTPLGSLMSDR